MSKSFEDGEAVSIPSSLIRQWTKDFTHEIYMGSFGSYFAGWLSQSEDLIDIQEENQCRRVAVRRVIIEHNAVSQSSVANGETADVVR